MLPAWSDICWDVAYRYLGVHIGPAAHERYWLDISRRLLSTAAAIAEVSSSWGHASFLYSTYCLSQLAYLLQFRDFDKNLKHIEARLIARVTSTPMHAVNHVVFEFLASNDRPLFPSIERTALATKLRVWAKCDRAQEFLDKYVRTDNDDNLLAVAPFQRWHQDCIIGRLGAHYKQHERLFDSLKLDGRGLQACLIRALFRQRRDEKAFAPLVRSRLAALALADLQLEHIERNIKAASNLIPLNVMVAWVKALTNAWTTSRRMGAAVGPCPFCGSPASDCMLHAIPCSVATGLGHVLLPGFFPAELPPPSLESLLGGCPLHDRQSAGLAIFLACVHAVLMHSRFGGSAGNARELACAKLRSLRVSSAKVDVVVAHFHGGRLFSP
jgi:hypothetical protein